MSLEDENLTHRVIGCAMEVHRELGPGLLESAYEACLAQELTLNSLQFRAQVPLPVSYKGVNIDCGYRLDLVVEDTVLLELKSVEKLLPIHDSQVLSYLKLSELRIGLLMNFNSIRLKDGIKRFIL